MERLYSQATASIQEKLDQAHYSRPARLPYRFQQGKLVDGRVGLHCGDDPFLEARLVSNLRVETTEDGLDVLHYVDGQRRESVKGRGRTYTLLARRSERHALYKQRDPGQRMR